MYQQSYNNYYPNAYSMQQQQTRLNQPLLKGRPVSSIDEVKAASVDFDGSIFYFPDLANNRIYSKQINLDGTSTILMYELKEIPKDTPTSQFVTREEFETVINQLKGSLPTSPEEAQKPAAANIKF